MTGKPVVDRRESTSNNGINTQSPFLSPQTAATSTATNSNGSRLLPSPIPPPTSSSIASQRPTSGLSAASGLSTGDRFRDDLSDGTAVRKSHSHSISSNPHTLSSSKGSASNDGKDKQRSVRTLPPWVQSADDEEHADATSLLLPRTPNSARPASHNYMPTPKSNVPGRRFDHVREGAPVTLSTPVSETASKWQQFAKASEYDQNKRPVSSSRGQVMSDEWMKENMPDLEEPWQPMDQAEQEEKEPGFWLFNKRKRFRRLDHLKKTVLNHAMVPLVVRMTVLTFSVLALSLAGAIYYKSDSAGCENNSSTWMAIIVDVVAILYTIYITLDEYTSKPLGLRSHNAKLRLIFLDLAFIVFDSANLSLAFQALTDDRWACRTAPDTDQCPYTQAICARQKALTATLLIALVAWLSTFAISTLRLVHRVAR